MLSVFGATIEIGDRVLMRDVSFGIHEGEKVALVGANGQGKTTLLRAIAGDGELAKGEVQAPERVAYLRQESASLTDDPKQLAIDYLLAGSPLTAMHKELDELGEKMHHLTGVELDQVIHAYSSLQETFNDLGGYQLQGEADRIATGVGLEEDDLLTEVGALSGGQRRRLELARLLLAGADLFILDEPTNHLDASSKQWVMNFLRDSPATVLMVSHDIKLMDSSIDRVLALENHTIDTYNGTYSDFIRQRAENEAHRVHQAKNISKETGRLEETKKIFSKGNATHAAKRRALQRRIDSLNERLKEHAPPIRQRELAFHFPEPDRAGDQVMEVTGLSKSFGDLRVLNNIELLVERGDVLLLVGVNGAGKTTLLRCLANRETPDQGEVKLGANVKLGFYAQEHEEINRDTTVLANMETIAPGISQGALRATLGMFGIKGDAATQMAGSLSGGEKTKLALARLMMSRANLLLLDEPTNNLDPQSVEALLAALQDYEGTVILVSHDASFVSQLAPERVLLLPESRITFFDERVIGMIPQR